jgi:CheY-like chemotaxis protein
MLQPHGEDSALLLLVEDDPDLRDMMGTFLELEGYRVVMAVNGAEAYNEARHHHPSLILLDLMMPVMGGEEFRRAQLANDQIRGIPVLVMSAHHEGPRIARRMRAVGCLTKPVDFDALLKVLSRQFS